ncbi:hypothetical protein D7D52_26505 [Nocardia yunnanensis]|uniref:Aminoacyl-transfer RNA synthetases class-II family profile domain-containing protein n=1 Tax=Nocardia yunnanensis TaxID=2382165 RepID=A0A386ZJK7_9NOCA|nr:hypothetical protein [Nocardia yunnanensis]AYF76775.1 hypothetical protein D7D52_26505 [Nocardia yunnanensis]
MISTTGTGYRTADGLAVLGPRVARVKFGLDSIFQRWAREIDGQEWDLPVLLAESQLAAFDYFDNFPHLAVAAIPTVRVEAVERERLFIASAACYGIYAALADSELDRPVVITVNGRCCRNEREYRGLRRLHHFTMRELVALGSAEHAIEHLVYFKPRILALAEHLGLRVRVETATDPFFDPNSSRAVMQRLLPVKEEVLTDDDVAIASLNSHRNFFGDRARIRHAGEAVHTSCVAFGLERWIHALDRRHDGDWAAVAAAVESFDGGAS